MTDEDLGQEIICGTGCLPSIGDIRHIGATARRLVTAELAAKALLDEGALVEAIAQRICAVTHHTYSWSEVFARAALSAMRPTLSACVARAEAAEAENARLREALANPPRHVFWGAGEPDCPREIKASNGELHTLRCKVCGLDNPRDDICRAALGDKS